MNINGYIRNAQTTQDAFNNVQQTTQPIYTYAKTKTLIINPTGHYARTTSCIACLMMDDAGGMFW